MPSGRGPTQAALLVQKSGTRAVGILRTNRTPAARRRWLIERQRSLGASDIACALDIPGAYTSSFALWWAKQPGAPFDVNEELTEEQEWGLRLEDAIAAKFAEGHPELYVFRPPFAMYRHPDHEWMTTTPDRLAVRCDGTGGIIPVELKTDQNADRWGDEMPPHIEHQLPWQCGVFGVRFGYVAALVHKRYHEYRREYTSTYLADLIDRGRQWWESLGGEPPEIGGHHSTTVALMRRHPEVEARSVIVRGDLIAEYTVALAMEREGKEAAARAKNRMRAAMGSAGLAVDVLGRKVATRSRHDRAGYTVAPTVVDEIRQAKGKGSA